MPSLRSERTCSVCGDSFTPAGSQKYCSAPCRRKVHYQKTKRTSIYKRKYGLSLEQYEEMLRLQGGTCALCGRPPKTYRLNVDHDHITGRVRGLLCYRCNAFVVAKNTSETASKLVEYLRSDFDGRLL
jgi:hypothetical protein